MTVLSHADRRRLFVTSSGTGLGKTFVTAALAYAARASGRSVRAVKPVVSGFGALPLSDPGILLAAQDLPPDQLDQIAPWRFKVPLAPDVAAAREGRDVPFDALVGFSRSVLAGPEDLILIEGVGGIMVPLDQRNTVLDWIQALDVPVLLVLGTYLGAISHALTAVAVLRHAGVAIDSIVVSESPPSAALPPDQERPTLEATARAIERFSGRLVTRLPFRPDGDWRHVPELLAAITLPPRGAAGGAPGFDPLPAS